jgi:Hypothetical protein (DUF2513)
MDLIREILLHLEGLPQALVDREDLRSKYNDQGTLDHHLELMHQSNLIKIPFWEEEKGPPPGIMTALDALRPTIANREIILDWSCISISWSGHEFLDAARDETLWNKKDNWRSSQISFLRYFDFFT